MQLTKTLEKAILKIYDKWMHSYLNGDITTYDSYLADDYHFIGSTDNEEFLNRKATTNFFKATAEQFAGKTELRNETTTLELFGDLVFITHIFDAWFLNGNDWTYYARFRFSSVLKEKEEGWKFIYQHFSIADSKADEGQSIGFDKINAENLELREAIKRRTFELEEKNRELEIEGALDRIRAQAVAMKESSDLLDIVVTMRNEFIKLGHEAHYFWHMMWLPEKYEKAMTSGDGTKIGFVMELPRHIHGDIPLLAKWEKSKKATIVYPMDTDAAIDYVDKMVALGDFKNIDPQAPSHNDIRHIKGLTFIMARTSHGEIGYSLPGVVKNPPKEDIDILVKFAGAFDLAHQRFLDLQKAEAQARETQIELALEKVRSRTMGMQRSDELRDTAMLLFQQAEELGINSFACGFNIWDDDKKFATAWMASKDRLQPPFKTNSSEDVYLLFHEAEKRGEPLFVLEQEGKELEEHYKYLISIPEVKALAKAGLSFPTFQIIHCAYFSKGYLMFITHEPVPDEHDVFKRFAKVFEQTYTRFLDLQKAEAQAIETQIELALEKVRSRTMAMQHSDELQETSFLLDEQVRGLGIKTWGCAFNIYGENDSTEWFGNEAGVLPTYTVPRAGIFKEYYQKGQKGESLLIKEFSGKACIDHYEYMSSLPVIGDVLKNLKKTNNGFPTYQLDHVVFFKYGYLLFITKEHVPEAHAIFKRFAKVFEQTYTRFLDLQKAEAQTRVAQIEASLERVRAKSMAMHDSDELNDVLSVLFQQFDVLGIQPVTVFLSLFDIENNTFTYRSTSKAGNRMQSQQVVNLDALDIWKEMAEKWQNDTVDSIEEIYYPKAVLPDLFSLFEETFSAMPKKERLTAADFPDGGYAVHGYCQFGYLGFNHDRPGTEEEKNILLKFAKEFERVYQRFLDIQKAEAQARESEIELALERVRARSMAMQKSDELKEVIKIVYQQLSQLNININHAGFVVDYTPKGDWNFWIADEQDIPSQISHPYFESVWGNQFNKAKKKGEGFFATHLNFEEKNTFYNELLALIPDVPKASKDFYLSCPGLAASTVLLNDVGLYIENFEGIPYTEEDNKILMRFGKVFQQSYTRFLDLQKSEAQAKESQIELGLERVRARAMAMQKSDELSELVSTVRNELTKLDFSLQMCIINIINEKDNSNMVWAANSAEDVPESYYMKFEDYPYHDATMTAFKAQKTKFVYTIEGEEKLTYDDYLFKETEFKKFSKKDQKAFKAVDKYVCSFTFSNFGGLQTIGDEALTDENLNILARFGKVFDLTYTRFRDLEKAEAQTREAQIEASLERVRASAMAMHKSDDLTTSVDIVFSELGQLGFNTVRCGIGIFNDQSNRVNVWTTSSNKNKDVSQLSGDELLEGHPLLEGIYSAWKAQVDYSYTLKGEDLKNYYKAVSNSNLPVSGPENNALSNQYYHLVNFPAGGLFAINDSEFKLEEKLLMKRFGEVFHLSFTRHLDLKHAEAQAREAQVEAALERTRTQSMLMQHSDELNVTAQVFHQQLQLLGIDSEFSYLWLPDETEKSHMFWATWSETKKGKTIFNNKTVSFPLDKKEPAIAACYTAWASEETVHVNTVKPDEVKDYFATWDELLSGVNKFKPKLFPEGLYYVDAYMKYGCFGIMIKQLLTKDEEHILSRFSKEFERTYSRFLGLQKAEAQAREAQIEAALEKVRSRSLAMHKSDELNEVILEVHQKFKDLDISMESRVAVVAVFDKGSKDFNQYVASHDVSNMYISTPYFKHPVLDDVENAKEKGIDFYSKAYSLKEKNSYFKTLFETSDFGNIEGIDEQKKWTIEQKFYTYSPAFQKNSSIAIADFSGIPLNETEIDIVKRFSKVFEQAYIRFLDLQKAEAQAREAQIETALEKVRSRTMAMQKGEELQDVVVLLYKELIALGVTNFATCGYVEINEKTSRQLTWVTNPGGDSLGLFYLPLTGDVHFDARYDAWKKQQTVFHQTVAGRERRKHLEYAITTFQSKEAEEMVLNQFPDPTVFYCFNFSHGYLHLVAGSQLTQDEETLLARFTRVFEQTYARFLDLKKAEAQAREAQIEAALEKVRSRSLAMHKPDELQEVVTVVAEKLKELGVILDAGGVIICTYFPDNKDVMHWISAPDFSHSGSYFVPYFDDKTFNEAWDSKNRGESYFSKAYPQEEKNKFFEYAFEHSDYRNFPDEFKQLILQSTEYTLSFAWQKHSAILIPSHSGIVPSESDAEIMKRFAKVFEQAYIRFMDLQKVEAQAREAQIETALEKVRSRTMAMQHSDELPEAANNLFLQVQGLGIPAWSAGYCIWEDKKKKSTWCNMSSEGEIQKGFSLPTVGEGYNFQKPLKNGEPFHVAELGGKALVKHYEFMKKLPTIGNILKEFDAKGIELPTFQIFHIVFFNYGFVMFITYEAVPDAHNIFKRFGQVFEQTYTRFLDLQTKEKQAEKLIEEKERLEHTLDDLKVTQKQLIQAEKMASLGELTAGIAHEIQNPLNFVNNFSEVSKELLEEMLEEMENGDMEEVKAIMDDVVQNLEKINHHGNRADGIVKGMLQHSRASSDKKEPVDINKLTDEYFRLAYHGLRAKDKSFNATLETNYDENLGVIDVIPQDIGRVILNLFTNAFYAVDEKSSYAKASKDNYKPTVSVSTEKTKDKVIITVRDNGDGIPKKVLDKIFQPFFTTKPTGKGTGLGLSMSYDIIKAHNGLLEVNTEAGKYTEFNIVLPNKNLTKT